MNKVLHPAVFKSYGVKKKKDMTKLYIEDTVYAYRDREEMLSEIWAANKKLIDGKWYVELSQVAEIVTGE